MMENVPGRCSRVSLGQFLEISNFSFRYNPKERSQCYFGQQKESRVRIIRSPGTSHLLLKFIQKPKSRTSESAKKAVFEASF